MITTVTMNPCIDKTVSIDGFMYGGLNRIINSRMDVGGKGINVAIVYTQLGGRSLCTGINYHSRGDLVRERLDQLGIQHDFVEVAGEVRVNLKIFDQSKGVITEINESGYPLGDEAIIALKHKLRIHSKTSSIIVFSGSVPKGIGYGVYKELMLEVNTSNNKLVLDAEGPYLLEGLYAKPYLIKPNLFELERVLGQKLKTYDEIVTGARRLMNYGVSIICVSMGANGAIILDHNSAYYGSALPVQVRSTVGAGDSMVAALCLAMEQGLSLPEMLEMGLAAATASIMTEGTQPCTRKDFDNMLPQVKTIKL